MWIAPSLEQEERQRDPFMNLRREMVSRKYSPKTIKSYIYFNRGFLEFTAKDPNGITEGDIKGYLIHLVEDNEVSTSMLNGRYIRTWFTYISIWVVYTNLVQI